MVGDPGTGPGCRGLWQRRGGGRRRRRHRYHRCRNHDHRRSRHHHDSPGNDYHHHRCPRGGIVAGADAEVDAVVLAYTVALDSVSTYEEKVPYIDDPSGLEDTVAEYLKTGESMGGIGVLPTAVAIDGDTAVVTYDLLFGGNPTYPDLTGDAVKTADGWKITRAGFCSLMSSARVGCP